MVKKSIFEELLIFMLEKQLNKQEGISVLIADPYDIYLTGTADIVRKMSFVKHINVAQNSEEVLSLMHFAKFNTVLIDVNLKPLTCIETLKKIRALDNKVKIVFMSAEPDTALAFQLMQLKVDGFILKSISANNLCVALQSVINNRNYISKEVEVALNSLSWQNRVSRCISEKFYFKSERIREMLFLICRELTTKEIAIKMNLSEKTVEKYRTQLIRVTGARNVVGLALYAFSQHIHTDEELKSKYKL
jgi:DNA-binding NarL/FixJ family response regulator